MKKLMSTALFSIAAIASVSAHADLVGDTVTTQFVSSTGPVSEEVSTIVTASGGSGNFFGNQFFTYGPDNFNIRTSSNYGGIFSSDSRDQITLKLGSLDFGTPITSVDFTTNLSGVMLDFGSNFVNFTWNEQSINGTYISAVFNVNDATVPEPTTVALLGLGLLGFAASRRKSAKSKNA